MSEYACVDGVYFKEEQVVKMAKMPAVSPWQNIICVHCWPTG